MGQYYKALDGVPEYLVRAYGHFATYQGTLPHEIIGSVEKQEGFRGLKQVEALIRDELNKRGISNIPPSLHEDLMKRNGNLVSTPSGTTLESRTSPGLNIT